MKALRNHVTLIGRIGTLPEISTTAQGIAMARFNLITTETYRNDLGERISETQWHPLIAWDRTAEIAVRYLSKGRQVAIEGRLITRHNTDEEGKSRYISEIIVSDMLLIGYETAE